MSSKLYNEKFVKVTRQHYGQLQLLIDWLALKAGGKVDVPDLLTMRREVEGYDSALIPDTMTGGATLIMRKCEKGLVS